MSSQSAWNEHIPFAGWLIEATRPRVLVELGTHSGVSYFAFCEAVRRLGLSTECFAVDHWLGDKHSGAYGEDIFRSVTELNTEFYDSFSKLLRRSFDEALPEFADGSVDLLHIDGLHTYEAVRGDFEAWLPKMSERGVVVLHDTNERKADFGVHQFLAEVQERYPSFEFTHEHGLGVVAVGPEIPDRLRRLVEIADPALVSLVRETYASIGARYSMTVERDKIALAKNDLEGDRDQLRKERDGLKNALADSEAGLTRARTDLERLSGTTETKRLGDALRKSNSDLKLARGRLAETRKQLASSRRLYKRLRSRKSVRVALRIAELARPVVQPFSGAKRRSPAEPPTGRMWKSRQVLEGEIVEQRGGSQRSSGPLVSIMVLTRNGASHMERLLAKLDGGTTYRSFEVIVVDNGSTDATGEVLGVDRGFPLKVVTNDHNVSFSAGNNQAAAVASGELLLMLNNDTEPINPGWLGAMVDAVEVDGTVACGAELVYPDRGIPESDLTVQHFGINFEFRDQAVRVVNIASLDPLDAGLAGVVEVPAATAAALMVKAEDFHSVGGFDEGYVYGTEDVDLCLKLRDLGKIVVTGQAVLFHNESATQNEVAAELTRVNRIGNRLRFAERWESRLSRSLLRDRFAGGVYWSPKRSKRVVITLTDNDPTKGWGDYYTAHELGDAFTAIGWSVIYAERVRGGWYEIDQQVDLVISLLDSYDVRLAPEGAFTIGWVRNWVDRWMEQPWIDKYDLLVASSHKGAEDIRQRSRFDPPVIPMATNVERFSPGPVTPSFEADYTFTGNNWGHGRGVLQMLEVLPGEQFQLFGTGWEKDPRSARYWRGHLDYELLPEVYRSTKVVLDDTASHTYPHAFLNARVFDALASGTLVLTNNVEGSDEMFGGFLPTYTDRKSLRDQLDHFLANDTERADLAHRLRQTVLANHSYARRPDEFVRVAAESIERPKAAIKIAVPKEEVKGSWGDTHFAGALAAALTRLGITTEVHILPEWDLPASQDVDIVIHLRGLSRYVPRAAHINVLWIISHPDDVTERECEEYDLVLVASHLHADWLGRRLSTPVVYLPQATDHRRFHPVDTQEDLETEVLFVGNSRGQRRPAVDWAIDRGMPLTVYGGGWTNRIPPRFVRESHFPNEQLAGLYASAGVVLNDHWPDMRERGFISNRIFDVLASGSVVVSDEVEGLKEVFGDLVPTFSGPSELESVVREILGDRERRAAIIEAGTALVAQEHTFERRADQIMELLRPALQTRQGDLDGRPLVTPSSDVEGASVGAH